MNYIIEEITETLELENFLLKSSYQNFMQTPSWGKFKQNSGEHWKYKTIVLKSDGLIVGSAMILIRDLPLINKKMWYIPRGFVVDYNNDDLVKIFCSKLIEYGRKNNAAFIKIDPYIEANNRDIDGNIINGDLSYNNLHIVNMLNDNKFIHRGFIDDVKDLIQPRNTLILDLSFSEEEIYKNFSSKTKQGIKNAIKGAVEVYEGGRDDIDTFHKLMVMTASKSSFLIRNKEYFEKLYDVLSSKDMIKLYLAKINTKVFYENCQTVYEDALKSKSNLEKQMKKQSVSQKRIDEIDKLVESSLRKKEDALKSYSEFPDGIIISSAIITYFGNTANYLFAASNNDYKSIQAPYLLQWEMIKDAKNRGCSHYDFIGVLTMDPSDSEYGIYLYKKRFASKFLELVGEFDAIIDPIQYKICMLMIKANKVIRKPLLLFMKKFTSSKK